MHFRTKNYLKNTRNHTTKHALSINPDWFHRSGGGRDQVERNIIMRSA
jgi:hypothetical protein